MTASAGAPAAPAAKLVARNTALRAAAEVLGKVATLGLTVVMLHQLGAGAVGDFGFALAVSQLYWPVAGFGLDRLMLREIAVDDAATARMVPQLNAFKLVTGLLCVLVGTSIVAAGNPASSDVVPVTLLLGLGLIATLFGATAQSVFMAKERTQDYFLAALPVKVLGAALGIAVLVAGGGLVAVATSNLLAALAGIAIGWWILGRRYGQPPARLGGSPRSWGAMAWKAGPWGLQEVFGQVTFRVGIIVLYVVAGKQVTGEYRLAYQLLEATLFLPWSIGTSILPLIARSRRAAPTDGDADPGADGADDEAAGAPSLESVTRGGIELVIALMLPVGILLGLCAEPVLALLGDKAVPAAPYLPYLAAASVIYGVGHIAGLVALSHLPGRRTIEATALAAAFSLVAVFVLVPTKQASGAAVAALATETVLMVLSVRLALRASGVAVMRGFLSAGAVAGLVMAAVVVPLRDDLLLSVVAGGAAYLLVLGTLEYRRRGPVRDLVQTRLSGSR